MRRKKSGVGLPGIYRRGLKYWYTDRVAGKKRFHALDTEDYGEAVVRALAIRCAPTLEPAAVFKREIDAFIAYKVAKNQYSERSAYAKAGTLRELADVVGKPNPAAVTTGDVARYYAAVQARVSESTARGYMTTVRSFYNWIVRTKKMRENPVKGVELAKLDEKGRQRFCTPEQRDRAITEAPTEDLRFVLFCGFHAGMRKNEIVEARPEWFDLERGSLTIRETPTFRPKDRQERTVPLTTGFRAFLASYGLRAPYMIRPEKEREGAIYRVDFTRAFENHARRMGMPWLTLHVMRHTFASLLASAGVSIYKIAKWMGDDVGTVQKHYAKLLPQDDDIEKAFTTKGRV